MFTSKYRWMAAFGTSIACHVVVFVVIGVVVALFPSAPVDKGPIQVDLVSLSGGGGGGGGSPDADNGPAIAPPSAEPTEVAPPPPALAEDMPEDAMNDIHEIADSVTESKEAATPNEILISSLSASSWVGLKIDVAMAKRPKRARCYEIR